MVDPTPRPSWQPRDPADPASIPPPPVPPTGADFEPEPLDIGASFDSAAAFMPGIVVPGVSAQPTTPALDTPALVDDGEELDDEDDQGDEDIARSRGANSDPIFGYLIALALAIGLTPLIPDSADLRYALVWSLMALFGVMAWLLGTTTHIERESLENLSWGVVFGLMIGTPLLLFGSAPLSTTAQLLFSVGRGNSLILLPPGVVLSFLIFTQPLAETLFFRGLLQRNRAFWLVSALSTVWSIVLFVPMIDLGRFPVVAVIISVMLLMVNVIYSYVRQRNGLAAAWLCQIVVNFVIFFLPYLGG